MLFIARRIGESIQIGPEVEVKIVRASRSRVLIAIEAPRSVKVLRIDGRAGHASPTNVPERETRTRQEPGTQRRVKLALR